MPSRGVRLKSNSLRDTESMESIRSTQPVDPTAFTTTRRTSRAGDHVPVPITVPNEHGRAYEQIFIHNPCFCECSLTEALSWIATFEFMSAMFQGTLTFIIIALSENRKLPGVLVDVFAPLTTTTKLDPSQMQVHIFAGTLHVFDCVLAYALYLGSHNRKAWVCILWMIGTFLILVSQIILLTFHHFTAAAFSPLIQDLVRPYYFYVVWAFLKEISVFPHVPPIPSVRLVSYVPAPITSAERKSLIGRFSGGETTLMAKWFSVRHARKSSLKQDWAIPLSAPIPIEIPAFGYGYYPPYYHALEYYFSQRQAGMEGFPYEFTDPEENLPPEMVSVMTLHETSSGTKKPPSATSQRKRPDGEENRKKWDPHHAEAKKSILPSTPSRVQ